MSVKSLTKSSFARRGISFRTALKMLLGVPVWVAFSYALAQVIVVTIFKVASFFGITLIDLAQAAIMNALIAAVVYILTIGIVIGVPYAAQKWRTTRIELGLTRLPSWTDIGLTIPAAILYVILSGVLLKLLSLVVGGIDVQQAQDVGFSNISTQAQYGIAFVTLVVMAPLVEETLFRGYLYGKLRKYSPVWISILVTSGLFGLAHGQWNVGIDTFALSLVLCSLREVTGSIWAGV